MNVLILILKILIWFSFAFEIKKVCKCEHFENVDKSSKIRTVRSLNTSQIDFIALVFLSGIFNNNYSFYDPNNWNTNESLWLTDNSLKLWDYGKFIYPLGIGSILTSSFVLTTYRALLRDDKDENEELFDDYLYVSAGVGIELDLHDSFERTEFHKSYKVHRHEHYVVSRNEFRTRIAENDLALIELKPGFIISSETKIKATCFDLNPFNPKSHKDELFTAGYCMRPVNPSSFNRSVKVTFPFYWKRFFKKLVFYRSYYKPAKQFLKQTPLEPIDENYKMCRPGDQVCLKSKIGDCPGDLGMPLYLVSGNQLLSQVGWAVYVDRLRKFSCHDKYFVRFQLVHTYVNWLKSKVGISLCVLNPTYTTQPTTEPPSTTTKDYSITTKRMGRTEIQSKSSTINKEDILPKFTNKVIETVMPVKVLLIFAVISMCLFIATVTYAMMRRKKKKAKKSRSISKRKNTSKKPAKK